MAKEMAECDYTEQEESLQSFFKEDADGVVVAGCGGGSGCLILAKLEDLRKTRRRRQRRPVQPHHNKFIRIGN